MAASSTNSWLNNSLLSPSAQQQSAQHALYAADLPMHHPPSHLGQQHHVGLGQQDHQQHLSCDTFCQPLHHSLNTGFHQPTESHQLHDLSGAVGGSCGGRVGGGGDNLSQLSARKVHKADREKLRRDRLNEQFAELAGVLDPDRPKNDKATILGDSVQVVKELRAEVKRLRTEHTSLLDESRDLAQEKTELREEKASLKNETEQLQTQLQQRLRIMMPWIGMDPSIMMGAAPYAYPMAVSQPVSGPPSSEANQTSTPGPVPPSVVAPAAYIPMAPAAPGAFAVHPALQAYTVFGNRPGEAGAPFMPYPHYPPPPPPPQVNSHSHVERPYAQYASPVQPLPGYLMQMHPHQGQPPISGGPPVQPMYRSYAPGMPVMPPQPQANQQNVQARANQLPVAYAHYPASGMQPYSGPSLSSSPQTSLGQSVQTTLQLQTPAQPQSQKPLPAAPVNSTEGSSKAQTVGSASASSEENKEPKQTAAVSGVSDSIASSPVSSAPAASVSSTGNGGDGGSSYRLDTGPGANKETSEPNVTNTSPGRPAAT